jgi:serine protease AprX
MKKLLLLLFIAFLAFSSVSASTDYYFFVQFKDKTGTSFSLSHPEEFLSARSIARRASFGVVCDSTDLPVNPSYINQISSLGIKIHSRTKWMNGVTVVVSDSGIMSQVRALSFVKKVQYTGKISTYSSIRSHAKFKQDSVVYGATATQANQINLKNLHNQGYKGKGMLIGIIDAGFYRANTNPGLDSLRLQGRLLGTKDIIVPGNNVYNEDTHGANVLSIITGNLPGQFLGTAPDASVWLIRTEYVPTENLFETDFWVSGIEFADSVGVDAVNSSLGYTSFDDTTMNYTYADMNGQISRASIAAGLAAQKGIVVCNSAGNEGDDAWHYIGAPADADGIFSVGSVTSSKTASAFSSFGPTSDNRIKPEVCTLGSSAALISSSGVITYGNGTSYSSPVMAGALTCLLQKYKTLFPSTLNLATFRDAVIQSGSLYLNPTAQLGYGIPDIDKVAQILFATQGLSGNTFNNDISKIYIINNVLNININTNLSNSNAKYCIFDMLGRQMITGKITDKLFQINCTSFVKGVYVLRISTQQNNTDFKFIVKD